MQSTKAELQECGEVSILNEMAILSLVGSEMKNMVGIAGKMFSTLGENNVNIEMISQGKFRISVPCSNSTTNKRHSGASDGVWHEWVSGVE
ncbi:ACT domain-containing protein [Bacillus velezensis]|uniref:ACT domain-containing protein n=1 Tax=Bacillus velezensis TaxID=492670 RepID=UPI0023E1D295|nr:ACT domain-containing protein [Bacillus velezensis]WES02045.1 ACT domain-containing protein [Bacillus velezensis]